jgi:predicted 3-demethylubiquinone-9 3-methyltransferase (glyoxalase superfamily)
MIVYGPDASTNGGFQLITIRSDGSNTLTPLSVSATGDATFAGTVTANKGSVTTTQSNAGQAAQFYANATDNTNSSTTGRFWAQVGGGSAGDALFTATVGGVVDWSFGVDNSDSDKFKVSRSFSLGSSDALSIDSSLNTTFSGAIAIGNTVNTVSPTSPNRTITMVIGGTTYYIHAKTTND